jgi:hypothetical protein
MFRLFFAALLALTPGFADADPHPFGLAAHPFNGSVDPVTEDGITRFEIRNHECSERTYGDGRGEHDCFNGIVRSALGAFQVGASETWTYAFEFRVPDPIGYTGWRNSHACTYLDDCQDSRLRIASWEGNRLHNFMYMLKADGRHGARFLNETCAAPEDLADWTRFRMEVRWADDSRGWIRVSCNDEVIYFRENVRTLEGPHCYITNLCRNARNTHPTRVLTILGPVMQGFGHEWQQRGRSSQFTDFTDPISVEMRNVEFQRGATLYDETVVRALQSHLTSLGCDPGPIDGLIGNRTRQAALSCRDLAGDDLPEELDAGSIADWLAAYQTQFPI